MPFDGHTRSDQATPPQIPTATVDPTLRESATFPRSVIHEIQRAAATGIYDIRGWGAKRKVPHFDDLLGGNKDFVELAGETALRGLFADGVGDLLLEVRVGVNNVPARRHRFPRA